MMETLPQIIFRDPDWFFWACKQHIFNEPPLSDEARDLYRKARSIRVPTSPSGKARDAIHVVHRASGLFERLEFVDRDEELHLPGPRLGVIDLGFPRDQMNYDKEGGTLIIKQLNRKVLGDPARWTKRDCEAFFDNQGNFDFAASGR
jgi:hypothetical protein